ncbi:MAG: hypothetical protein LBI88_00460 [Deltaproteobacteria bacterium]|jgi:hypothetical protein|nr:hypothetical protein [Deltaproteobacteria bacterium]
MTRETISLRPVTCMQERIAVFDRMVAERRIGMVQYSLPRPSLVAWMEGTAPDRAWFCVLKDREQDACAVWITDFTGKAALVHFVVWRGFGRLSRELCWAACRWAFSGGLSCLMGIIPEINRAALAAMRDAGWQEVFRIPQVCYIHRLDRHVDGVLCHCTPKLLRAAFLPVIPAQAGIQESIWTPAFAGVTDNNAGGDDREYEGRGGGVNTKAGAATVKDSLKRYQLLTREDFMKKLFVMCLVLFLSLGVFACCDEAQAGNPTGGGGKSAPSSPPPPAPAPIPDTTPQEAESKAVRDDERRKLAQKKGVGGTVLAPLGRIGGESRGGNTLLGRIGA